jgi:pyruvate/2-oxoglutarate dehydrogenase complex dihydrolipoamide dehydrogenase (E3) component
MPYSNPSLEPLDADNLRLREAVHPLDWVNPVPAGRYNLVVIGAGTAGLVMAAGAAGLGARVALVERDLMGGDCLNVGCVPSKALLRSARAAADARAAAGFGVRIDGAIEVDFAAVMARLRRERAAIAPHDSAARFRGLGVDVFLGEARFTGPDAIAVGGRTLRYARAAVATGARATIPDVPGLAAAGALTNETVFSLTALPARLGVIGAGPVGCELAQAFARLGSRVTLVTGSGGVLPRDDRDAASIVAAALTRDGVAIEIGARLTRAERIGDVRRLTLGDGPGARTLDVDAVLVAAGRSPSVDLGLEAAGIAYDRVRGVQVDDRLRTTNPRVFAAGDVCSTARFTHLSDAHARLVIRNALFAGRSRASTLIVPHCTYTDPEIAQVGLTRAEADRQGLAMDSFRVDLDRVDRARLDGESEGFAALHVARKGGRLLGATIVARHAGDLVSEITALMRAGAGIGSLADTIHPYPTQAEVWRKAADAWNRTRLTPAVKRLFARWLAWQR